MQERYEIIKRLYPNYLILILKKGKIKSLLIDNDIMKNFDIKNTNKVILNNLNIEHIYEYEKNNYWELYTKIRLINKLKELI